MTKFIRFPEGKPKALTFSYDDGVEQDIQLINILDKYGLKCTFNLNSGLYSPDNATFTPGVVHRILSKNKSTALYSNSGHEIAVHSLTHPHLENLSDSIVLQEIKNDRQNLEQQFKTLVRGMAYPYGTYTDKTIEILKKAGIAYARTVISTDDFRIPTDWYRLTATCHHVSPNLMNLAHKFTENTPLNEIDKRDAWLFYVWGHSYEFESENNWEIIENFAKQVSAKSDVWYATNIDIYRYIKAYNHLQFSVCGRYVYNPSAIDIYFEFNKKTYMAKAGDLLAITS